MPMPTLLRRFPRLRRALFLTALPVTGILLLLVTAALVVPLPELKPYSTVIEDRNGLVLRAFPADDGIWRIRTLPEEIPTRLNRLIIEKEDRYFYYHPGVNPVALVRAALANLAGRRVGASTITMQVARMLEPKERTVGHKLVEMFRAVQLELRYSKAHILELYLSMIPEGGNIEGLKAASWLYYRLPLERLNTAQMIDLTLIPNNPNGLRPDRNGGALFAARQRRLASWMARGICSRTDSLILTGSPAGTDRGPLPVLAPHFSLRVGRMYPGEPEVVSSLDLRTQRIVESLVSLHGRKWAQRGVRNAAALVIENRTREVIAYVGSEDFGDAGASGQVDAVAALRSPGSALKPFLYAMEFERGTLTPKRRLL